MTCTACFVHAVRYDGTYKGKVIDVVTGEPIEGVVVLGWWEKEYPTVAGPMYDFYDAKETVTDKNGEFEISGKGLRILSNLEPMRVMIFKTGFSPNSFIWESEKEGGYIYREDIKWKGNRPTIPLKKLTMEQRRKQGIPNIYLEKRVIEKTKRGLPVSGLFIPKSIKLMVKEINKELKEQGLKLLEE